MRDAPDSYYIPNLRWICECGERNDDEIDPVYGPFFSCTCGGCGKAFDQNAVQKLD